MSEDERRAALAATVCEPPGPGQLARACLLVARGEHPDLDADACHAALARLAERVRGHEAAPWYALREVLGLEAGFRGDHEQYESPINSYLNLVLDRRRGLPILLSVVWIEVARGAGLSAQGIGLPGHFIVSVGDDADATLVDPFDSGTRLTPEEALARGAAAVGRPSLRESHWLRPVTADALVQRVLTNLAGSYERRSDDERLERVLSDMLALDPGALATRVRRGEVRGRRRDLHGALEDLNHALGTLPPGPTFDHIRAVATRLARLGSSPN